MPIQRYLSENVLEAARKRVAFIFDCFEVIHISISGGKDSTVLAHLALIEARRRGRRVGLVFIDEEVVYQSTIDQIQYLMNLYPEVTNKLWLQFPFTLTNATSLTEAHLQCWEPGKHKLWMRPKEQGAIWNKPWDPTKERIRPGFRRLDFYGTVDNFERCYSGAAFLIGLRGTESPNRWRAVVKNATTVGGERVYWATPKGTNTAFYPIYDWNFHDVWRYIAEEQLRYCRIYDMQFKKGFSHHEMRVSSLIHEKSFKSLCELPEFEPKTYERLCRRIAGIPFAQETGKSAKMFAVRKLPKNHSTWRGYRDFLLSTYPDAGRSEIFRHRFARQLNNEFVARQQCRQLVLNDYENNLPVSNREDPREELIRYYETVL